MPTDLKDATSDSKGDEQSKLQSKQLFESYVLGTKLQAERFCNAVMDKLTSQTKLAQELSSHFVYAANFGGMLYVFASTKPGSPLRKFVVANVFSSCELNDLFKDMERNEAGAEFAMEMAQLAFDAIKNGCTPSSFSPLNVPACSFHVHRGRSEGYDCSASSRQKT